MEDENYEEENENTAPVEETNEEEATLPRAPQRLTARQRRDLFLKKYPNAPKYITIALTVIIVLMLIIYYFAFYKPPMERYAIQFCNCANQEDNPSYTKSMDDFEYIISMHSCFVDDFEQYAEGMTIPEKKAYLLEFQARVLENCPQKLDNVFKYE